MELPKMPRIVTELSPSITKMIRMDHSHVMVMSHRYTADASPNKKAAIARNVCLALEIHAQLEEEIFYPALRAVQGEDPVLDKSKPEHDEMRRLIAELRSMAPDDARHDATFAELIRNVLHHVADEETVLLPAAERLLKDRLGTLGAEMTKRRLELLAPHAGEVAMSTARAMPVGTMLMLGGLLGAAFLLGRQGVGHGRRRAW